MVEILPFYAYKPLTNRFNAVVLKSAASAIILAHNHPSGNLKPSEADKRLHEKIKKVAGYLDVQVLDKMIVSKDKYFCF